MNSAIKIRCRTLQSYPISYGLIDSIYLYYMLRTMNYPYNNCSRREGYNIDNNREHALDVSLTEENLSLGRNSSECFADMLLSMNYSHFYTKPLVDMLREVLCTVNTSMLTTRTAKTKHQMCKTALYISCHMLVGQGIDMI